MNRRPDHLDRLAAAHSRVVGWRWQPYVIAVVGVIVATLVRDPFTPFLGPRMPFLTFHVAIVLVAWLGGIGPGLVATVLSVVASIVFVVPTSTTQDQIGLGLFAAIGLTVSMLIESLHRARLGAQQATAEAVAKDGTVRDILARTTDAVVMFDVDWRFMHANKPALTLLRRSTDQLATLTMWDAFPQTIGSELQQRLTGAMTSQQPDRFETYVTGLDLWAEMQVVPSPQGATLFITDTTAAHATARQRAVLAAINEAARTPGGGDEVGSAIAHAVGRLLGVARCAVGYVDIYAGTVRILRDYLDAVASIAGTHRIADYGQFIANNLRDGVTTVIDDVRTDIRISDTQRGAFGALQVVACVDVPIMRDGQVTGIFVVHSTVPRAWTAEDVALLEQAAVRTWAAIETARAASLLRQSEERLRLAVDAGQLGVWDWDLTTNGVTWSDRLFEIHGIAREQFSGHMEADLPLTHPDDRARVGEAMAHSLRGDGPYRIEFRAVRPDGGVRWLFTSGSVFRDDFGKPVRVLGATLDITDRKRHEEQREQLLLAERSARADAERAGRMKDEFLATLSHELRTPLNAIFGWSQIIRGGNLPADELQYGLETIERNARVQTQLIDDLLDMSRIISGKVRLEIGRLDIADVVAAAVATVRPTADAKEILLQSQMEPGQCYVNGDPNRLQQVVWNLLTNAIKFTPRGGRVRVELLAARSAAVIATADTIAAPVDVAQIVVTDSGQGISPEFLPHVFDRFRQADASTTRRHGGLGLGLSIVKQLAEMHGGTVFASSDGLGNGASFTVSLPLLAPIAPPSLEQHFRDSAVSSASRSEPVLAGLRILVVDDEADARELIARMLSSRGASVQTASNTTEAIAILSNPAPLDLLVSDIGLPVEDGYSLIRGIRANTTPTIHQAIPAIALTAYVRAEDRTKAILAGFQVHLTKPVEPAELISSVASLMGRSAPVGAPA